MKTSDPRSTPWRGRPLDEALPFGQVVGVRGEWWSPARIFLIWGILNPNGPTLYLLGAREFAGKHRTFMRWLHMLGGETFYASDARDEITYDNLHEDAVGIDRHLFDNRKQGGIFTSFLPS